eukprot:ctg_1776.g527
MAVCSVTNVPRSRSLVRDARARAQARRPSEGVEGECVNASRIAEAQVGVYDSRGVCVSGQCTATRSITVAVGCEPTAAANAPLADCPSARCARTSSLGVLHASFRDRQLVAAEQVRGGDRYGGGFAWTGCHGGRGARLPGCHATQLVPGPAVVVAAPRPATDGGARAAGSAERVAHQGGRGSSAPGVSVRASACGGGAGRTVRPLRHLPARPGRRPRRRPHGAGERRDHPGILRVGEDELAGTLPPKRDTL